MVAKPLLSRSDGWTNFEGVWEQETEKSILTEEKCRKGSLEKEWAAESLTVRTCTPEDAQLDRNK
jgi:hypothetical protein